MPNLFQVGHAVPIAYAGSTVIFVLIARFVDDACSTRILFGAPWYKCHFPGGFLHLCSQVDLKYDVVERNPSSSTALL